MSITQDLTPARFRVSLRLIFVILPILSLFEYSAFGGEISKRNSVKTLEDLGEFEPQSTSDTIYIYHPEAWSEIFVEIYEKVGPSVVTVTSRTTYTAIVPSFPSIPFNFSPWGENLDRFYQVPQEREYTREGLGSGVIVSEDGYIVTNNHVIEGSDDIEVILSTGQRFTGEIVGTDPKTDVAVIHIDAEGLPFLDFGDSNSLRVGEWVLAIGSPFAFSQSITQGIISYIGRTGIGLAAYENYIQTDAAINPGNSGGALVNLKGELIGINTAIASRSGGYQGVGFAIPVGLVEDVMFDLISHGVVIRGWLGVALQEVSPELAQQFGLETSESGVLITEVVPDTPAEKSGIQRGDIVLEIDGESVETASEFMNIIAGTDPGTRISLLLIRDGSQRFLDVTLDQRPDDEIPREISENIPELGWRLHDLDYDIKQYLGDPDLKGVLVTEVDPSGKAARAGITRGDVILEMARREIDSVSDIDEILFDASGDILILVWREGRTIYLVLHL